MDSQDKRIIADVEYDKIKKAEEEYKASSRKHKLRNSPPIMNIIRKSVFHEGKEEHYEIKGES